MLLLSCPPCFSQSRWVLPLDVNILRLPKNLIILCHVAPTQIKPIDIFWQADLRFAEVCEELLSASIHGSADRVPPTTPPYPSLSSPLLSRYSNSSSNSSCRGLHFRKWKSWSLHGPWLKTAVPIHHQASEELVLKSAWCPHKKWTHFFHCKPKCRGGTGEQSSYLFSKRRLFSDKAFIATDNVVMSICKLLNAPKWSFLCFCNTDNVMHLLFLI